MIYNVRRSIAYLSAPFLSATLLVAEWTPYVTDVATEHLQIITLQY